MISALVLSACVSGVISHEGFRHNMYKDRNGWSIGNGYSLTSNPLDLPKATIHRYKKSGISEAEAKQLVVRMCNKTATELSANYDWFTKIPSKSQYVMLDMGYNLGVGGLAGFDKTLYHIKNNQTTMASKEMLRSRWSRQVKNRSKELSQIIKTGIV